MSRPDEAFIVRVRPQERDAVVEQPRLGRRSHVRDVGDVGPLILRWLEPPESRRTKRLAEQARRTPEAGKPGPEPQGGSR